MMESKKHKHHCDCRPEPAPDKDTSGNGIQHELRISRLERHVSEIADHKAEIKDALENAHIHHNMSCLNKLGRDDKGYLTYDKKRVCEDKKWVATINKGEDAPADLAPDGLVLVRDPKTGILHIGKPGDNGEIVELEASKKYIAWLDHVPETAPEYMAEGGIIFVTENKRRA